MAAQAAFASQQRIPSSLRTAVALTAVIDLVIGLAFLFGPELTRSGVVLWPTDVPAILMRFIGSIVFANGVGAALIVQQGTWEGARVLFTVAWVYGVVILFALLYHLLFAGAPSLFWGYVIVDAIFLAPILYIYWTYERGRRG